jgi:Fic family protein
MDDVREVSNYVAALNYGLKRLAEGFPLSLRLMKEMHAVLLSKGRGANQTPGEFRRTQNWIGGTRPGNAAFVHHRLSMCWTAWAGWSCFCMTNRHLPQRF